MFRKKCFTMSSLRTDEQRYAMKSLQLLADGTHLAREFSVESRDKYGIRNCFAVTPRLSFTVHLQCCTRLLQRGKGTSLQKSASVLHLNGPAMVHAAFQTRSREAPANMPCFFALGRQCCAHHCRSIEVNRFDCSSRRLQVKRFDVSV